MRLIDADRLLTDRMKSKYYHLPNGDTAIPIIDIEHAPTVEERKKGEWESFIRCFQTTYHSADTQRLFECSVCRYNTNITTRFCPNCGADMRGEEE